MSQNKTVSSEQAIWQGKPWITPAVAARTIVFIVVSLIIIWVEFFTGTAIDDLAGFPVYLWTAIAVAIIWLLSVADLLVQRAANTYVLRADSLELKQGILSLKSYTIVSSGFTDLEVIESVTGRMLNYGDIIIRLQGDVARRMVKVKDPMKVGDQVRTVLARPIVRIENPSLK